MERGADPAIAAAAGNFRNAFPRTWAPPEAAAAPAPPRTIPPPPAPACNQSQQWNLTLKSPLLGMATSQTHFPPWADRQQDSRPLRGGRPVWPDSPALPGWWPWAPLTTPGGSFQTLVPPSESSLLSLSQSTHSLKIHISWGSWENADCVSMGLPGPWGSAFLASSWCQGCCCCGPDS